MTHCWTYYNEDSWKVINERGFVETISPSRATKARAGVHFADETLGIVYRSNCRVNTLEEFIEVITEAEKENRYECGVEVWNESGRKNALENAVEAARKFWSRHPKGIIDWG